MLESLSLFAAAAGFAKLRSSFRSFGTSSMPAHRPEAHGALDAPRLDGKDRQSGGVWRVWRRGVAGDDRDVVDSVARGAPLNAVWLSGAAIASVIGVLAGELFERSLFFTAMSSPRMPGALGA